MIDKFFLMLFEVAPEKMHCSATLFRHTTTVVRQYCDWYKLLFGRWWYEWYWCSQVTFKENQSEALKTTLMHITAPVALSQCSAF